MTDREKDLAELRGVSDFVYTSEHVLMAILKSLHRLESLMESLHSATVRVQNQVADSPRRKRP